MNYFLFFYCRRFTDRDCIHDAAQAAGNIERLNGRRWSIEKKDRVEGCDDHGKGNGRGKGKDQETGGKGEEIGKPVYNGCGACRDGEEEQQRQKEGTDADQ